MPVSARALLALLALSLVLSAPAAASWRIAPPEAPPAPLVSIENRFIPGFLRRGEGNNGNAQTDQTLRIEQLEAQVRTLTGQVEELTFALRQLEARLGGGENAAAPAANPPLAPSGTEGAPSPQLGGAPAPLGETAASAPFEAPAGAAGAAQGPIDLSALNQGLPSATSPAATGLPGVAAPQTPAAEPVAAPPSAAVSATTSEIAAIRTLQDSGRYGRAAEEARSLLSQNPGQSVAAEARFLLGEALLAQGDYRTAANYFLENYTADPTGARGPASLLKLGTALNSLGESGAACSSLEELLEAHPNADPALRAEAERQRVAANCT